MMKEVMWITGALCLLLATVVGVTQFTNNDVKDVPEDRYDLSAACVTLLRSQVNLEMHASLVYANMASHFDQSRIARKGFAKLFLENSKEEREHAQKFIDYLNSRRSKFLDFNIDMPEKTSWGSALEAVSDAITLEKTVNNQLHHMHDVADVHCKDAHLMDFLEREFLDEQVESIDGLYRHAANLEAMNTGMGEYLYDQQLLN